MFLKFLKRIFGGEGKPSEPKTAAAPATISISKRAAAKPLGTDIEVASLSLRVIIEKLPPDLRAIINKMPEPEVKIMLPLNSILKQLPTGAVRMSLASLLRQAPAGTFRKSDVEGKQMVEIPLAEVFRNVDPKRLSRRQDQRRYDVPDDDGGLFDRTGNSKPAPAPAPPQPAPAPPLANAPRVLKMPEVPTAGANGNGHAHPAVPAPKANAAGPCAGKGDLVISFVELAASWPEGVRSELSLVPGDTRLVIPALAVGPGLQKGKVTFPWSQVRRWMSPAPGSPVAIRDDLELILPLKIIAPAFVAATGATKRREGVEIDHTLPDFFGAISQPPNKLAQSPPVGAPALAPTPHVEPEAERAPAAEPECTPAPEPEPLKFSFVSNEQAPVAEVAEIVAPEPVALPTPVAAPQQSPAPTPAGLVKHACSLPGVAGAVVALEEGLVVAQSLPPGFAAETFAAFMPQIFGRLGQYTAEMQLGAPTEVTIHTAHGPFHAARCGKIYFGMLGHPGERLPENLPALISQLPSLNS